MSRRTRLVRGIREITGVPALSNNETCGAKTRRGHPCRSRSMPNGRCRLHEGKSPGAPKGNRNAWKHGKYSAWTKALAELENEWRQHLSW
ncbi:HGGxSTG domain-containing protein [Hyphomonas oceanitis]|uniref:HGGxSTG domain-containing protein n=1 Tax=Hyphomonas oceanitis TaxID=81033 RepID=UPI003AB959ED